MNWVSFKSVGPCFTAVEEDGGDKRLAQLEVERVSEADGVASPDPV